MNSENQATANRAGLHLLWALPVAIFLSYYTLMISVLAYCGFGGCTSDQAMELSNLPDAAAPLALTFILIAIPIFVIAWSRNLRLRAAVAVVSGVLTTAVGFAFLVATAH